MPYWWIARAAVMAASAIYSSSKETQSNNEQAAWNNYNAQLQYNTDANNIRSQQAIASANVAMTLASARQQNASIGLMTEYNISEIKEVTEYNNLLFEKEIDDVATARDLDLKLLKTFRDSERGSIEAAQSVSGTLMGTGSNADTIVQQMTNAALDEFVIKYGADKDINAVRNARAKSEWEARKEISRLNLEGQLTQINNTYNANLKASGMALESSLNSTAGWSTAGSSYISALTGAALVKNQNANQISANTVSGLSSAAGTAVSGYIGSRGTTGTTPIKATKITSGVPTTNTTPYQAGTSLMKPNYIQ